MPDRHILLQRKLAQLFPDETARAAAAEALASYGPAPHHREAGRVRLALLKLAGHDLRKLREGVEIAKHDYRDVLAAAEYPAQAAAPTWKMSREETQPLIEQDRAQYNRWLAEEGDAGK